jgi:DNA-directed RNA polymerase subunit RPC12/RpoP
MEQDNSHGDAGGSTPSPNTPSCLVDQFPEVAAEWHPTRNGERSPSWVTPGSKYRAWWLCSVCGSEWQARVGSRTRGHGCPSCGRELAGRSHAVPKPGTSLAEWFPDVAAEWHPTQNGDLTPDLVCYASNKSRCRDCQHEWQIQVSNRSRESSCRRCAHRALGAPKPELTS